LPSDFPNYAAVTWVPEDAQRLLSQDHSWPLPTELWNSVQRENIRNANQSKMTANPGRNEG